MIVIIKILLFGLIGIWLISCGKTLAPPTHRKIEHHLCTVPKVQYFMILWKNDSLFHIWENIKHTWQLQKVFHPIIIQLAGLTF